MRYDSDNQTILYEKQFSYKGNKLVSIKEDKGGLTSYINYEYDNVGHLIKETHIDNNQKTFHTVNYLYENDTLKSRTDYDANNNEIARYIITHVPGGGSDVTTIPENLPDSLAPFFYKPMGEGCYIRSINHQTGQWHYHRQYTGEKGTAVSETRNGMSCGYELDGNGNYAYYEETIKE
ncbi:MAG: hypothetical protein MJY63_05625 [Paludibacteraceae bacterium]|nr:hypothetical protein [Paludibacteraceae bacterium]